MLILTRHCKEMLEQRDIREALVFSAVENPDRVEDHDDDTRHYLKKKLMRILTKGCELLLM